jgi:ferredoxin--NADP+ reductase
VKNVTKDFESVSQNSLYRFFGNVTIGDHIRHAALLEHYSGVVYASGAPDDSMLGIPGDDSIVAARTIVNWYNAYPNAPEFDLTGLRRVAIIGNGNVALDIARILVTPPDLLAPTDIAK